ncbi:MAG: outer membrane lipoprotein carrier protein LolA [Polyangiaceae bacterium]|nr:outer membrane lipoprotein carrier protein LolA [Polyangiaceae bacterium]
MNSLQKIAIVLCALIAAIVFVFTVGTSAKAGGAPPTADQIAARVQAFYNQTRTYQARFQQDYTVKAFNKKKQSTGRVAFERPGKMSWKYDTPNGNRVVCNGTTLKVYEKENKQMFEQPIADSQYPAALAFLMGKGELSKSFTLKLLDAKRMNFEGGYVLEGTPKTPTPAYQKVLMYIDASTAQVRRMLILDAQGNRNMFTFENPVVNTPIPAEEFAFEAPEGTTIVHP